MKSMSSIIRIVCGLVLIAVAGSRYFSARQQLAEADGAEVRIFGYATAAEPWLITLAFGIAGLVGLTLAGLGVFTLLKKMQEG
jgi:hypothetical protein